MIIDATNGVVRHENDVNWELFGPRNNRFFLASGSVGPAFMNSESTHKTHDLLLRNLVDVDNLDDSKLHVVTKKCPMLLRKNLHELFPVPEVITDNEKLSLITLSQADLAGDHEKAAINFVLAAREICSRLRNNGFWADFLNPMSGRPYLSYRQQSLYTLNDVRFRGLCMKMEEIEAVGANENCLLISEDESTKFSGTIFTNIPADFSFIRHLIFDEPID